MGAPGPHRKRGSIRGRVFSAGKTQRRKKCTFLHVAHSIPPLHFFLLFFELFREMVPVQLPRPLRAAAAAAVRPRQVRALSSPAPRRAIGGGAGRATPAAPEVGRRRQQCPPIVKAAAALSPSDPDAPPPYELEDYTPEANAEYWETRPVSVLKRGLVIGTQSARERSLFCRFEKQGRRRRLASSLSPEIFLSPPPPSPPPPPQKKRGRVCPLVRDPRLLLDRGRPLHA